MSPPRIKLPPIPYRGSHSYLMGADAEPWPVHQHFMKKKLDGGELGYQWRITPLAGILLPDLRGVPPRDQPRKRGVDILYEGTLLANLIHSLMRWSSLVVLVPGSQEDWATDRALLREALTQGYCTGREPWSAWEALVRRTLSERGSVASQVLRPTMQPEQWVSSAHFVAASRWRTFHVRPRQEFHRIGWAGRAVGYAQEGRWHQYPPSWGGRIPPAVPQSREEDVNEWYPCPEWW